MTIKQLISKLHDFRLSDRVKFLHYQIDKKGQEHLKIEIFDPRKQKQRERDQSEESFF